MRSPPPIAHVHNSPASKFRVWVDESGWFIAITPEAGPVKDKDARRIPLHSHVVDLGFIDFVKLSEERVPLPHAKRARRHHIKLALHQDARR